MRSGRITDFVSICRIDFLVHGLGLDLPTCLWSGGSHLRLLVTFLGIKRIRGILARLDAARSPDNMEMPGLDLHPLDSTRLLRDRGGGGLGREPKGPLRASERQDRRLDGDGHKAFQGIRRKSRELAPTADAV